MIEWLRGRNWAWWLGWVVLGVLVGGGVWAFSSGKPNHDLQLQVGYRGAGEGRIEVGLYSTDYAGEQRWHLPSDNVLTLSQLSERYTYSQAVDLAGYGPRARVTTLSDGPEDVQLGFRVSRPNGSWGSSRFPSREALTSAERESADWVLSRALAVRVHVNQPLLAGIRLAYYVLFAFLVVIGATMYVWRRWLN